jgi:inner membrane protein
MATDEQTKGSRLLRSPAFKFFLIVLLTVAMAVPLFFIQLLLSDREQTASGAATDVAAGWGGPQVVAGPMLFVPYTQAGDPTRRTAVVLPENLDLRVQAGSGTRSRGIFAIPVYRADIKLHATFDKAALARAVPPDAVIAWGDVSVAIRVSDAHGLADNVTLVANGRKIPFGAGIDAGAATKTSGIQAPLSLSGPADLTLDTQFSLRGSREFSVAPLGRRTTASISSPWNSPSFFGPFLPVDRVVNADGFKASWVVPYLARGFGQSFETSDGAMGQIEQPAFGARFYMPVDYYQVIERSLKYAILFIALAFLAFFVMETVSPRRLHAMHYALVGAAQVLFYLLLLSLSEHAGFASAYLAASVATVALTSLYAASVLASRLRGAVMGAVLGSLYGLFYVILNAQDEALLIGSALLFLALAATMYATRKIDWYAATGAAA